MAWNHLGDWRRHNIQSRGIILKSNLRNRIGMSIGWTNLDSLLDLNIDHDESKFLVSELVMWVVGWVQTTCMIEISRFHRYDSSFFSMAGGYHCFAAICCLHLKVYTMFQSTGHYPICIWQLSKSVYEIGPGSPEEGLGSDYVAYVFVFLSSIIIYWMYKLTLSDQAQITLQLTVSFSDLV
jgi:hypothetical protein